MDGLKLDMGERGFNERRQPALPPTPDIAPTGKNGCAGLAVPSCEVQNVYQVKYIVPAFSPAPFEDEELSSPWWNRNDEAAG